MSKSREPRSDKLKEVYRERTVDDQRAIYRDWAESYDAQTTSEFGWMGFKPAAEAFAQRVKDKSCRVLDAGCGTGLSGVALGSEGFTNLHGIDLSPEMLAVAQKTGAYQTLAEADLTQPLRCDTDYDAVIAVGVFGFGPPDPEHIPHLIKAARSGGLVFITVNGKGWVDQNWPERLKNVIVQNNLKLVEELDIPYLSKEEIDGKLLVFRAD